VCLLASVPARTQGPTLATVIDRAAQYALTYEQRFSILVAEEDYYQRAERSIQVGNPNQLMTGRGPGGALDIGNDRARRMRSDYLLVRSDEGGWLPFRDVFEVDGRRLRDREDRMVKLLLAPSPSAMERATRIAAESARYNLGRVTRTINIPTLAVLLPRAGLRERMTFSEKGVEQVAGRAAWLVGYEERAKPTLVQSTSGVDMPMSGTLWVEPETGVILKTAMSVADTNVVATVEVDFREDEALDLWVPAEMREYYRAPASNDQIRCTATYSNYRKFSVSTDEVIEKPPPKKPGGGLR
jgi:hypothetical protein